jgi:pentose-5-phosphate-3-epimerase
MRTKSLASNITMLLTIILMLLVLQVKLRTRKKAPFLQSNGYISRSAQNMTIKLESMQSSKREERKIKKLELKVKMVIKTKTWVKK